MDSVKQRYKDLKNEVNSVEEQLKNADKLKQLNDLSAESQQPDFWNDSDAAQSKSKRLAKLQKSLGPWQEIDKQLQEIGEFVELGDESLTEDLEKRLGRIEQEFESLKKDLRFSGPHDDEDAIVNIQSGAGGTDAQDWAEMLMKMYAKWADNSGLKVTTLSESSGEEAGIKSVSMRIAGDHAYGRLKSEHGVHRLVRLSPFNSANSRETSFAMVEVTPEIDDTEIEVNDEDLKIDVYRAGGHGGQSVNTTDSAVRITHVPTNVVVAIQNERSQIQNKATAMSVLRSKLAQLAEEQHAEKISELKGPNVEAAWGNQIRSYVLHPYTLVKDNRTGHETSDTDKVLNGRIDGFIEAYLQQSIGDGK